MWKTKLLSLSTKLMPMVQKYRYALIILLAGLVMLCVGAPRDAPDANTADESAGELSSDFDMDTFQNDLQEKLSHIVDVGQVELLLSMEDTETVVYASNVRQSSTGDTNASYENNLTILSDGSYGEQPVRVKSVCPTFRGAVVLCQGGDKTTVRLAITEAVSTACGLSTDKISVLKMQNN